MSITFEWNGKEVEKRAKRAAKISSYKLGLIVEGQAKMLAPVGIKNGGRLRSSITTVSAQGERTRPNGENSVSTDLINKPVDEFETFVGTPVEYGPYVEYGTIKSYAQPFLRPALDMIKGRKLTVVETLSKNGDIKAAFGEYLTTRQTFSQTNEGFSE